MLAGAQWALAQEAPLAPFFRKVLFIGFFAFLINNWETLATVINQSGALLGLRAGGSSMTLADLHNPGRVASIGTELFGRTVALGEGMNIITDFGPLIVIYVAAFTAMLGFFLLALQVFVALIAVLREQAESRYPAYAEADLTVETGDTPHAQAVEDLQEIYALDPQNQQLELLLASDIQELEKIVLRTAVTDRKYAAPSRPSTESSTAPA